MSLPHTVTHIEYNACAYTMKVYKFCKMMKKRGHTIYHYGHQDSEVDCDEHISVTDNDVLFQAYGSYDWRKEFFKHNVNDIANVTFNKRARAALETRLQPRDIVLLFWGQGHRPIFDHFQKHEVIFCEPGIGYYGSYCPTRVFESWALFNHEYGTCRDEFPSYYHTVIPNYFDPDEFSYSSYKRDYFLCLGRIDKCKGVDIAIRAINSLPQGVPRPKLIIAGQGDISKVWDGPLPDFVKLHGYAGVEQRRELLKYASGLLLFSLYIEPFGGVVVEAGLSGTPVITNNWGAFTETVIHGVNGWRIQNQAEIIWALRNIHKINTWTCREVALSRYSLDAIGPLYEKFFDHCYKLTRPEGWYLLGECMMDPVGIKPHESSFPETICKRDERPRVAIWCQGNWAMGRIYSSLIKYTRNLYNYTWYNWDNYDDTQAFIKHHTHYSLIITTAPLEMSVYDKIKASNPNILIIDHSPQVLENCPFYGTTQDPSIFGDSTRITLASIEKRSDIPWLPTGADIDKFQQFDKIRCDCKRIGFVGWGPNTQEEKESCSRIWAQNDIKRPDLFLQICEKIGCEPVFINNLDITADPEELYGNIDILICCSQNESGPLGIFEAAACGIPVISTHVGLLHHICSMFFIKTPTDVEKIIKNTDIVEYAEQVTREIRGEWSFEKLIRDYWVPEINKKITVYNKHDDE